ncbi:helix-turn-helix domain-containing protein [Orbus mooreae]|uniref:helix-turn-helix domain-containing protein n=1 Tax=Orbus mooreae TaxID=3074107 RepID=UPI00370D2A3D
MEINISQWVKAARLKAGLTQDQLSEKLSMTKGNLSAFENGRTVPSFAVMIKICQICDVQLPTQELKSPTAENSIIIDQLTVSAECGTGEYSDYFELKGGLSFSKEWLRDMKIDPLYCYVIYAKGLSMYPTLQDGQAVLIDTSQTIPVENKVFLIARDLNGLIMKRISRNKDGDWIYISDNQDKNRYPNMFAFENDKIIGRVVWTGGNAGL